MGENVMLMIFIVFRHEVKTITNLIMIRSHVRSDELTTQCHHLKQGDGPTTSALSNK